MATDISLKQTPLVMAHRASGARMVPFAGYEMPLHYEDGILAEHNWTRGNAGLFDVSHMGQAELVGPDHETTARALEALVPADILGLEPGKQRYTQLLNPSGGIIDDVMVSRGGDDGRLALVVNAAGASADYAHMTSALPPVVRLLAHQDRALLALQGPKAAAVLAEHEATLATMSFMSVRHVRLAGIDCVVSRAGYTGEDGFEIALGARDAPRLWAVLTGEDDVRPVGLGARDTLRLEAGLCLYGHDIDETTSPIEAGLAFSVAKRRRQEGGFPGAKRLTRELSGDIKRQRVGITVEGRQPAREGCAILDPATGLRIGIITSGGFSPTVGRPVAMGYLPPTHSPPGTALQVQVRDKRLNALVTAMPFVPHRYVRAR